MRIPLLACVLSLVCASAAAAQDRPPPVRIEAWPLEKIAAMGEEIYVQDVAAWVATDALLEHLGDADPGKLAGWIVVPDGADRIVRFVQSEEEQLTAGYDVRVSGGVAGPVVDVREGTLSEEEQGRFRARQTAAANIGSLRCSARMNSVVAENPDGEGWLVWLLTSTTQAGVIPMGGHYRFLISEDGRSVVRRDQLSAGCLNLSRPSGATDPTAMLFVTQIVSDMPVETHVFLSLQNKLPIAVGVSETQAYVVNGTEIEPLDLR
jgi:hypothetical protein